LEYIESLPKRTIKILLERRKLNNQIREENAKIKEQEIITKATSRRMLK